jgi:rsbT co-antagonist protein RsbR
MKEQVCRGAPSRAGRGPRKDRWMPDAIDGLNTLLLGRDSGRLKRRGKSRNRSREPPGNLVARRSLAELERRTPAIMIEVRRNRLEQVLNTLAQAALGNFEARIPDLEDAPGDEFLELEVATNMLIAELELSHRQTLEHHAALQHKSEQLRQKQAELVRALSTPIIVVAPGVLALPIIGAVEVERAQTMTEALLQRVMSERATHVILDLTGAADIAAGTADSLLRIAQAVRLLGSRCIVTGISPAVAQALVSLDFDGSQLVTLPQLADGLTLVLKEKALLRAPASISPSRPSRGALTEKRKHAYRDSRR